VKDDNDNESGRLKNEKCYGNERNTVRVRVNIIGP
jgi:hypothetical protein